jgi:ATP-dependent exoDNAse (exonuclease V) beta subunit
MLKIFLKIAKSGSIGDWIGVVSGLLSLANAIAARLKEADIREDERRKIFAEDIALLTKRLDISEQLHDELEKLSDAELDDALAGGRPE